MDAALLSTNDVIEVHEVANIFPMMSEDEYKQLIDDIRVNGLREPIWLHENKIIDGRNRYKACKEAGVSPRFREWDGKGSLIKFVVSLNLHRRHLNSSQRAMLAVDVEKHLAEEASKNMSLGGGDKKSEEAKSGFQIFENPIIKPIHAAKEAAAATHTNHQYVVDAKKIVTQAPELKEAVLSGVLNIPDAKAVAKLPEPQRAAVMEKVTSSKGTKPKTAILEIKKAENEAQAQAAPTKPQITLASWETWLPQQEMCDLLITDPPYSTDVDDIEAFANAWLPLALSKVKPTGRAYVCIGAYPRELQAYLNVKACLPVQQVLVWSYKNTMGPSPKYDYKLNWQAILYFRGPDAPDLNCDVLNEQFSVQHAPDSAQEINAPDGRQGNRYHAWQKPIELAEQLVRHSTKPGDTVLDCFAGTGTFMLAAHGLGRVAYGCDRSPEMLEHAKARGCEVVNA